MEQNQSFKRNEALKQKTVSGMLGMLENKPSKLRASPSTPLQTGIAIKLANGELNSQLDILSEAEMSYLENIAELLKVLAKTAGAINEQASLLRRGIPNINLAEAALVAQAIDQIKFDSKVAINKMGIINHKAS